MNCKKSLRAAARRGSSRGTGGNGCCAITGAEVSSRDCRRTATYGRARAGCGRSPSGGCSTSCVGRGLPVPRPVAARYQRSGLYYRCDLITERIVDAQPLSAVLAAGAPAESAWRAVGAAVARLHHAGIDHADLNAHNILVDAGGAVSVIDFDRGRLRVTSRAGHAGLEGGVAGTAEAGALSTWAERNLERLRRSLAKISSGLPSGRYSARDWQWFMAGYRAGTGGEAA